MSVFKGRRGLLDCWGSQVFLVLLESQVAQVLKVYLVLLGRMAYLEELDQEEPKVY